MTVWPENYLDIVDFRARCFVNGTVFDARLNKDVARSGHWSRPFRGHPWVEQSTAEGWDRDLRQQVIATVKRRILAGQRHDVIEELMPDAKWVAYHRARAARERAAAAWRAQVATGHGSVDAYLQKAGGGRNARAGGFVHLGEALK